MGNSLCPWWNGKVIEALETLMKEEGIKIHKNSEIEEI